MESALAALKEQSGLPCLPRGLDAVDGIVVTLDTSHTVRPAGLNPIFDRRLFCREHLAKGKEVHGLSPYVRISAMDDKEKLEYYDLLLTETIQELMIYRKFVDALREGAKLSHPELDSMLFDVQSDTLWLEELRRAWRTYLEGHLRGGGMYHRTLLLNFVEAYQRPPDPKTVN